MIVLAIDTAGADCSAALYESDSRTIVSAVTETIGRGHAERLMEIIDRALDAAGLVLDRVQKIAVTVGPGSFTGIRVGVATARGLALALGIDAVGVSTLHIVAMAALRRRHGESGAPVLAAMDARRGEIYVQAYSAAGEPMAEPAVLPLDEAIALARGMDAELSGSAAGLLAGTQATAEGDRFPIELVAELGAKSGAGKPSPLYLRGPDAKPQTGFAVSRA